MTVPDDDSALPDVDALLDEVGFDAGSSVLTRRQAEVLVYRERGAAQTDIADELGTSRANVSSIEASARENVAKARETVAFADALDAPVRVPIEAGTDLYDVPNRVYSACDDANVKVTRTAPELMRLVGEAAGDAVQGRQVRVDITVAVTGEGEVTVRRS
ncbi:RNA polymerase subunit sigma-70 [Haloglomus irregulare]|uniref:RNA polymerase subunit sigma-70 n=1 Tax=Haloglomus irregulare TaxID=2234134 RepID=A0A554NBR2_9EURY|nr:RNA polymerase subunit sigma-70 [Haloglomus irregulare]